ncbi:hypothetical protein J4437_00075 [Candidatus Woesearchaeota archaeon]|nr:hypothetical protein [Candidatus Woesearchaeota archaeon]
MDLKQSFAELNQNLNNFFNFIADKLKNYKNLSLGEQIAYPAVGLGLILLLVSLVMFVII